MSCTAMTACLWEQLAMKKAIPPIHETPEELKQLLHREQDPQQKPRVHALYLLQSRQAHTRRQVGQLLGVHRKTIGHWLAAYATGGLTQLLTIAKAPGKAPLLAPIIQQALQERLAQPQGFAGYKAIWQWLRHEYGVPIAYKTMHKLVRYHLRAKLKVPTKSHIKKP
jgi:transposase